MLRDQADEENEKLVMSMENLIHVSKTELNLYTS